MSSTTYDHFVDVNKMYAAQSNFVMSRNCSAHVFVASRKHTISAMSTNW